MKKLLLLVMMTLTMSVQGQEVIISWTGNTCQLPAVLQITTTVSGMTGPLSYAWTMEGNPIEVLGPSFTPYYQTPGVYSLSVSVGDPLGNVATDTVQIVVTDSCTTYTTITGRVYNDQNGNCVPEEAEPSYYSPTWQTTSYVEFLGTSYGSAAYTVLIDSEGYYSVTLPYDTSYQVVVRDGWYGLYLDPVCPSTDIVYIHPDVDTVANFAMTLHPWKTVSGHVFADLNGNCIKDDTEYGYAGRYVYHSSVVGPILDGYTTTDSVGYYSFMIPAGSWNYYIGFEPLLGDNPVCPASGYIAYTSQFMDTVIDFSNTTLPMSQVSGHLYADADAGCTYDAGEITHPGLPLRFQSAGGTIDVTIYAGTDGYYHTMLPYDSTYTITVDGSNVLTNTCPATGAATIALTVAPAVQDFALACVPSIDPWDLAASGSSTNYNTIATRWLWANLQNMQGSCIDEGAVVRLSLHPALSPAPGAGFDWQPDSIVGQDIYWHVDAGSAISYLGVTIPVETNGSLTASGDTICSILTILHNGAGDASAANDTAMICGVVNGSFDPNDKAVSPQGVGPQGYLPAQPQTLSYLIRFQNTGTDTAYNIVVRDTLSAHVDWSTLKVLNASHPINMTQGAGGAVAFSFPSILLPDSNVNEAASHGFVAYSVKMHDSLAPGTPIANTAYIYFDNNTAVVTNTTLNTVELQAPAGVQSVRSATTASIFPNPASAWITIAGQGLQTATLTDASGRVLRTMSGQGALRMDVRDVPEGMYWLRLSGTGGAAVRKVAVVR